MNNVTITGNLVRNPELKTTPAGKSTCAFTVAVSRGFKNKDGKYDADFPQCVAWGSTAEFVSKYFKKGDGIEIVGNIRTRFYEDKDKVKRFATEIYVDKVSFRGKSGNENNASVNEEADDQSSILEEFNPEELIEKLSKPNEVAY